MDPTYQPRSPWVYPLPPSGVHHRSVNVNTDNIPTVPHLAEDKDRRGVSAHCIPPLPGSGVAETLYWQPAPTQQWQWTPSTFTPPPQSPQRTLDLPRWQPPTMLHSSDTGMEAPASAAGLTVSSPQVSYDEQATSIPRGQKRARVEIEKGDGTAPPPSKVPRVAQSDATSARAAVSVIMAKALPPTKVQIAPQAHRKLPASHRSRTTPTQQARPSPVTIHDDESVSSPSSDSESNDYELSSDKMDLVQDVEASTVDTPTQVRRTVHIPIDVAPDALIPLTISHPDLAAQWSPKNYPLKASVPLSLTAYRKPV